MQARITTLTADAKIALDKWHGISSENKRLAALCEELPFTKELQSSLEKFTPKVTKLVKILETVYSGKMTPEGPENFKKFKDLVKTIDKLQAEWDAFDTAGQRLGVVAVKPPKKQRRRA